ncbi:hypothetical protein LWI29_030324 [Acer saccharum]|uniref:RNase H type-1 domain-containing protein n=1 Tax=Acer saccharum TaxID=4024 RepID=A0AA39VNA3_ACESA|nr:hypothetical protein LWI29_030324 [Acer saccharum]
MHSLNIETPKLQCEFHGDHGHRTEDCIAFKYEVVELLKQGHLWEFLTDKGKQTFVRRDDQRQTGAIDNPPEPPRQDRVINYIASGSEVSGVSYSTAKRHTTSVECATYQRLINKIFAKMLGSTMEVYIDDMLVKSLIAQQHIDHLRQSFDVLDQYGQLTKWAVEISEYDIGFHLRPVMKLQVLVDFITDFTPCESVQAEQELVALTEKPSPRKWTLSIDGSNNIKGSGLGLVLKSPKWDILEQSIHCDFRTTNNEAEYEALIIELDLAKSLDVENIQSTFDEFTVQQIPRSENARADALASLGSTTTNGSKSIPVVHLMSPTIQEAEILALVDHGRSWMEPIFNYLQADILPEDRSEARKIKAKAVKFSIIYGKLYKKSFTGPYLRCVTPREAYDVMKSLHFEECGNHSG